MRLSLVTAPTTEPVTLDEAKAHLRVDGTAEDALITALIQAAREHVESQTGRALITQTWDGTLDSFPARGAIVLPKPPLVSVTSVKHIDAAGAEQTMNPSDYSVEKPAGPHAQEGRILLGYGKSWPSTRCQSNAVTIRFEAGYGAADKVPAALKAAMLLAIGDLYQNRERQALSSMQFYENKSAELLLFPFRILRF